MGLFDDLSDYDFELLVADLLGAELDCRFETFPRGPDGGIDLRVRVSGGFHYAQCKHFVHSTFAQLKLAAEEEARTRAGSLPDLRRYTFATSRRLTAANKAIMVAALGTLVSDERDVLGYEDLAAMLRRHPGVERAHVKLWLRSVAPLEQVVHAEVHARSRALIEDIRTSLPRYVQTRSFSEARVLLIDHHVVIVAGPPGVGKTTLARLLLLDSAAAGHTPYGVQSDIAEAWRLFQPQQRQVFFFDDFLGRTRLFDGVREDPRDLASFIREVRRSDNTRLILATREYVLQQARQEVEDLKWQELDVDRYALTLDRYSRFERARIFYNHVYFSPQVDRVARADLLRQRAYLRVIDHPAYSPRLIEWMTGLGGHDLDGAERRGFAAFCLSVLDNPEELWAYAYGRGLGDNERCLLLQLAGLPTWVSLADLEMAYRPAARVCGLPAGHAAFESAIKVVQDSFIRIASSDDASDRVSVLNPSLIDFLKRRLLDDPSMILTMLRGAWFFDQVDFLHDLLANHEALPTEEWIDVFAAAAERTSKRTSPGRIYGEVSLIDDAAERLQRLVLWCRKTPALLARLASAVEDIASRLPRDIEHGRRIDLIAWPRLLEELDRGGFPIDALASRVKRYALAGDEDLDMFVVCSRLDALPRSPIDRDEWYDLQERLEKWVAGRLEEPAWFDDPKEVDRLEDLAAEMEIGFDPTAFMVVRSEVIAMQERDADSHEDEYYDDEERFERAHEDDEDIDALFGHLARSDAAAARSPHPAAASAGAQQGAAWR